MIILAIGTRIIYDRKFLLDMRNSPYTKTPPSRLAIIPDILNEEPAIDSLPKVKSPDLTSTANDHSKDCKLQYYTCISLKNLLKLCVI